MREYRKPTLVVTSYSLSKVNICTQSDIVDTESMNWSKGTPNALKNGLK